MPPQAQASRSPKPDDTGPSPKMHRFLPLVTLSPSELEAYIRARHGIVPAAAGLGIKSFALTAYCYLHNIATPSRLEIAAWAGKQRRAKISPQHVRLLVAREKFAEAERTEG